MNNKNFFEKNIERLVKLTRKSDKPSEPFEDSLTKDALAKLSQKETRPGKRPSDKAVQFKQIFAYAAAVIFVCAIGIWIITSRPGENQEYARRFPAKDNQPQEEFTPSEHVEAPAAKVSSTRQKEHIKATPETKKPVAQAESRVRKTTTQPRASEERGRIDSSQKQTPLNLGVGRKVNGTTSQLIDKEKLPSSQDRVKMKRGLAKQRESASKEIPGVAGDAQYSTKYFYHKEPVEPTGVYKIIKESPAYLGEETKTRFPMAHGGTTPPNGKPVDAVFFENYGVNPFIDTEDDHLSTFAIDVDTGSYTVARKYLHEGFLPPKDAVRVEEFVNYFQYKYPAPLEDDFAVYTEITPWEFAGYRKNTHLLRFGIKGRQISEENRKPAILTFIIDTSGSMKRGSRLEMVKKSLRLLVDNLKPSDKIGIAAYNTRGRKVLDYKALDRKYDILAAIDSLHANGSTYAEEGIKIGYEMAEHAFQPNYINRVILCSDGVANVGKTDAEAILEMIKEKADKGITLSAVGFGMSNYNDVLLEKLGDKGDGHYAYVDTIAEVKRIFQQNLTGTLQVIARDVKIQVDFNPDVVRSYRLIGYENRDVPDDKFRDDKYDGGEIGAGHSTTALYEIKLWPEKQGNISTLTLRYKDPTAESVTEIKDSINTSEVKESFETATTDFKLAAVAAQFAEILRNSYWAKAADLAQLLQQAQSLLEERPAEADIIELIDLISKANRLMEEK